jgi:hypothetical protein
VVLSIEAFRLKFCMFFSSTTFLLHVVPISSSFKSFPYNVWWRAQTMTLLCVYFHHPVLIYTLSQTHSIHSFSLHDSLVFLFGPMLWNQMPPKNGWISAKNNYSITWGLKSKAFCWQFLTSYIKNIPLRAVHFLFLALRHNRPLISSTLAEGFYTSVHRTVSTFNYKQTNKQPFI